MEGRAARGEPRRPLAARGEPRRPRSKRTSLSFVSSTHERPSPTGLRPRGSCLGSLKTADLSLKTAAPPLALGMTPVFMRRYLIPVVLPLAISACGDKDANVVRGKGLTVATL